MQLRPKDDHETQTRIIATIAFALAAMFCVNLAIGSVGAAGDGTAGEDNLPRYWEIHAFLLTLGTALIVASYAALWLKFLGRLEEFGFPAIATRISRLWYKWHMYIGAAGVGLTLAGVAWGYLMVDWAYGGAHLRVPHAYVGIATGIVVIAPLLTGLVTRALRKRRATLRWWHAAVGLVAIALMVAGLISGWAME